MRASRSLYLPLENLNPEQRRKISSIYKVNDLLLEGIRKKVEEASETETAPAAQAVEVAAAVKETVEEEPAAEEKPTRKPRAKKKPEDAPLESKPAARAPAVPEPSNEDAPGEPRRGWWQRTFG